jgi:anti-anti-sigma factor
MPLTTTMSPDGRELTISIPSRLDFGLHAEFCAAFSKGKKAETRYTLDFAATQYLDSSGIGMLLILREHAGGDKATITIRNCRPAIVKILTAVNFQRLFRIEQAAA